MIRPLVKICGTTSVADALLAADYGADYLGIIVEHAPSPRSVSLACAREIAGATGLPTVAVTVNKSLEALLRLQTELQPAALQLHGDESPALVRALVGEGATVFAVCSGVTGGAGAAGGAGENENIRRRAMEMTEAGASAILVDARAVKNGATIYGGTGHRADWEFARELSDAGIRLILAGGLDAGNVAEAISLVQPWMVDAVSGVEAAKGIKDADKVRDFIVAAKGARVPNYAN